MITKLQPGLLPTPRDDRDFQLGAITELPKIFELPEAFKFETLGVKDQGGTDFCSAFASDLVSEIQEGVELCPEWGFAASKRLSGSLEVFGQDIRTALKRHVEYGALPVSLSPFSLANKDDGFLRDIKNWPEETFPDALPFKKKSYFKITGPYDAYDNIRSSIWRFRLQKQAGVIGLYWRWPLDQVILRGTGQDGFGHMIAIIGWNANGLVLQNSAGPNAGDHGCHTLPREEVNYFFRIFQAYMLVDLDPEEATHMLEHGIKLEDNWLMYIIKGFIGVFIPFLKKLWM